ncbi:MAG: hypothetical protein JXR37_22740 [Kiritimatiellae bacterium]|nr:hypothetical protein [Kiritimatiellia bacterium]
MRVKRGYNPNSSSVGSAIPAFLAVAAGAGVATVVLLHAAHEIRAWIRRRRTDLRAAGPTREQEPGAP